MKNDNDITTDYQLLNKLDNPYGTRIMIIYISIFIYIIQDEGLNTIYIAI
jgi:hypothetical protein